ncbi:hypothetical protein K458DRAFT_180126 [Lentithecium fluviatile CBS 122367]|uniref:Uncharacterized protein n=1 Tax=Lentithecium fluviatile CBS 122367 TaxID=1168545 RepID=A0A6G1IEL3_9PLEO|nr:hypothetical protein K458DRAFT_180126 [Lentithecium fluviatile CBS 122367]
MVGFEKCLRLIGGLHITVASCIPASTDGPSCSVLAIPCSSYERYLHQSPATTLFLLTENVWGGQTAGLRSGHTRLSLTFDVGSKVLVCSDERSRIPQIFQTIDV